MRYQFQRQLGGNEKLQMMSVQIVDVGCTEESPIQNHFDLLISQRVHVGQQFPERLHVGDVSRQLPVIERQTVLLTEKQTQIDLCEVLMIFVFLP